MSEFPPLEIFRRIVDELEIGVYITDRARKIQYWNRGAERITGYLAQDVMGRFCRDNILVHCDYHNPNLCAAECPLSEAMRQGEPHRRQIYLRHHSGYRVPVEIRVFPLHDQDGIVTGAIEVFTEHASVPEFTSQNLVYAACGCLDEATDVPNQALSESYLQEQLNLMERHRIPFAVFVVRADHLQDIHNLRGRDAEVAIMSAIANTLRHTLQPTDFLGRWGDDRFVVSFPYSARAALEVALEHLRRVASCTAIPWWGDLLSVNISAGWVKVHEGDTLDSLKSRIESCFAEPTNGRTESAKA